MLDKADLALLKGARLRVVSALSLSSRDKRHHPGGKDVACVVEVIAWLVAGNNTAVTADAELYAEHVKEDNWSCVEDKMA